MDTESHQEKLLGYAEAHSQPESQLLEQLNRETHQKVLSPRMLSGHLQGRILSMISKILQPGYILEIGTYTGYSALCLAEGLKEGGVLHTIDVNEELFDMQRKYFERSPFSSQIVQHLGKALDIIPKLNFSPDLVFIDADKENYKNYLEAVLPKMKKGGIILSDNVLWSGKVVEPLKPNDRTTRILLEYNEFVNNHPRLESVLLPIRDGLTVTRVKE